MGIDEHAILIFGGLHLVAALMGCGLLVLFLRSEPRPPWTGPGSDEGSDDGGGTRRDPPPPRDLHPTGGIPLPDAQPSEHRFRGPGRLADAHARRRRGLPEPGRDPRRRPVRRG